MKLRQNRRTLKALPEEINDSFGSYEIPSSESEVKDANSDSRVPRAGVTTRSGRLIKKPVGLGIDDYVV